MNDKDMIDWLLKGDVSIQYQVHRDLLGQNRKDLQEQIENEGWGKKILEKQKADGHWGKGFYQPKWTSTHYTLLDLRYLCISPQQDKISAVIRETNRIGKRTGRRYESVQNN